MSDTKLFLVCHNGSMDGDCAVNSSSTIEITDTDLKIEDVRSLYAKFVEEEVGEDEEEAKEQAKEVAGAWIINTATMELMDAVREAIDPCDDGEAYACNRALKAIANAQAIREIGETAC